MLAGFVKWLTIEMISIKKVFFKLFRRYQKKPFLKAYAEKCITCDKKFKEGDQYIGLSYERRVDLDIFYSKILEEYEITQYIFSRKHGFKSDAICYDCFNNLIANETFIYYGYDYIHTPPDFFKDRFSNYKNINT
jgi:hypothetical protein